MNIEEKNTLFIVLLVSTILTVAFLVSSYLIGEHLHEEIQKDLTRSRVVFAKSHDQIMNNVLHTGRFINSEPALRAATLTRDMPTIEATMQNFLSYAGVEFIAYYQDGIQGGLVGASHKPNLSSVRALSSGSITSLIKRLGLNQEEAIGHAVIQGEFFHLIALPVLNHTGARLGVLVIGSQLEGREISYIKMLVDAEFVIFHRHGAISGTLPGIESSIQQLYDSRDQAGGISFVENGIRYVGSVFPVDELAHGGDSVNVLLAVPRDREWNPYEELTGNIVKYMMILLLIASLIAIYLSRKWLTQPIKSMAAMVKNIAAGNFDLRADEDRKDELGDLGRSFNNMLMHLEKVRGEEIQSKERFTSFAESSSDWLWETNDMGAFTYVSTAVFDCLAVPAKNLIGHTFAELFGRDNTYSIMTLLSSVQHKEAKDIEVWLTTEAGMRICVRLSGAPYFVNKEFMGYRGTARDITKAKNDETRLERLANKDHLSGLLNRRSFMAGLERELNFAMRQQTNGAVLMIDLDHFKLLNDTAGHAAGDEVIIQIASLLRRLTRATDLVARLGGDEFVIALTSTDVEQVNHRASEIIRQIAQLKPSYSGKMINASASAGMVLYPVHGENAVELLSKAETAMYVAKKQGRNCVHLYEEGEMAQENMGTQLSWKERIHAALEDDRFVLAYQAVAPTSGDPITRYEVLVRMKASDGSLHMPGSFIPVAEELGLINQIDGVVVRKALRVLSSVAKRDNSISFSINLSGLSVGNPDMMRLIGSELERSNLDRSKVIFEVTESAAFQDIGRAMTFIAQIKSMGCRIALDDFGVGFSSFSYLKQLDADILKIDGSFIRDLHKDKHDQLFVKALVDVAKGMGMLTVGEFVENAQCFDIIREFGVDYAQGYFIAKPRIDLFTE